MAALISDSTLARRGARQGAVLRLVIGFALAGLVGAGLVVAVPTIGSRAAENWDCARMPGPDTAQLSAFLNQLCHVEQGWAHDQAARLSGPVVDGVYYGVHGATWVQIFYSPQVYAWLVDGGPADRPLPTGSLIVKQQYVYDAEKQEPGPLEGWTIMLKDRAASFDGWYWAYIGYQDDQWDDGMFYLPYCVACHASADNRELTFITEETLEGLVTHGAWTPPPPMGSTGTALPTARAAHDPRPEARTTDRPELDTALAAPDPAFLEQFAPHQALAKAEVLAFPPSTRDHVVTAPEEPPDFVTADICGACHDAGSLLANKTPDMMVNIGGHNFNLSPFGEWRASMMGLGGRDPVFHAQVEAERARHPELAAWTDNLCFSCHGVMGQRQLELDTEEDDDGPRPFTHDMVYAGPDHADAKYGALARDGVSCAVCHHITPEELGVPETYNGRFYIGWSDEVYGPYADVKTYSMENGTGISPRRGRQINDPALCGSCHTVSLPVLEAGRAYQAEEVEDLPFRHWQTTYLEWRNSAFWDPADRDKSTTCQNCHMRRVVDDIPPFTPDNPLPLAFRIANIQTADYPDYPNQAADEKLALEVQRPYGRHTLAGINLFVREMFEQFAEVLGVALTDVNIAAREQAVESLALAAKAGLHEARVRTAQVAISDLRMVEGALQATVRVDNKTGHKFPSGVGFRRAFLEVRAEDADGKVLWASGRTNALGQITGADGAPLPSELGHTEWQPHHQRIDQADKVQIYEIRYRDETGVLTTSVFAQAQKVKDNRLLPRGWQGEQAGRVAPDEYRAMAPCGLDAAGACAALDDTAYRPGAGGHDEVVYVIPADIAAKAKQVKVRLLYQAIPPYYLRDLFEASDGPETRRLYHLASRLNLAGLPIEGWVLPVAEAARAVP